MGPIEKFIDKTSADQKNTGGEYSTKKEMEALRAVVNERVIATTEMEQHSRRLNLRIRGLMCPNENSCKSVVLSFLHDKMQMTEINENDIEEAYVVRAKQNLSNDQLNRQESQSGPLLADKKSTIVLRLTRQTTRDRIIANRKLLKGSRVSIVEDLTVLNVQLLNRVLKSDNVKEAWSWNGKVFAKLVSGKKISVKPFQSIEANM